MRHADDHKYSPRRRRRTAISYLLDVRNLDEINETKRECTREREREIWNNNIKIKNKIRRINSRWWSFEFFHPSNYARGGG